MKKIKNIFEYFFKIYKENARIVVKIFGIKFKFKNIRVNQLEDCCCIANLPYFKEQGTIFPHPVGIVINPDVKIGKNCRIYQNVTLGNGKYNPLTRAHCPVIGDNVKIYSGAILLGGISVGNNAIIGAGSVVLKDVPESTTVAGNPAKIIKESKNIEQ